MYTILPFFPLTRSNTSYPKSYPSRCWRRAIQLLYHFEGRGRHKVPKLCSNFTFKYNSKLFNFWCVWTRPHFIHGRWIISGTCVSSQKKTKTDWAFYWTTFLSTNHPILAANQRKNEVWFELGQKATIFLNRWVLMAWMYTILRLYW